MTAKTGFDPCHRVSSVGFQGKNGSSCINLCMSSGRNSRGCVVGSSHVARRPGSVPVASPAPLGRDKPLVSFSPSHISPPLIAHNSAPPPPAHMPPTASALKHIHLTSHLQVSFSPYIHSHIHLSCMCEGGSTSLSTHLSLPPKHTHIMSHSHLQTPPSVQAPFSRMIDSHSDRLTPSHISPTPFTPFSYSTLNT